MLSLIVVQKLQIQDTNTDFNSFLIAGLNSAALFQTNLCSALKSELSLQFINVEFSK